MLSKNVLKDPYVSLSYVSYLRRASTLDDLLFNERKKRTQKQIEREKGKKRKERWKVKEKRPEGEMYPFRRVKVYRLMLVTGE